MSYLGAHWLRRCRNGLTRRSEQRTPVGLSNHPVQPNMATIRHAAGRRSGASSTRTSFCPSDRLSAVADGTDPRAHPPTVDTVGGSTQRGTMRDRRPRSTVEPPRVSSSRCAGRLPSRGRIKCDCARRAYEDGTTADGGSIPPASTTTTTMGREG